MEVAIDQNQNVALKQIIIQLGLCYLDPFLLRFGFFSFVLSPFCLLMIFLGHACKHNQEDVKGDNPGGASLEYIDGVYLEWGEVKRDDGRV